MSKDWAFWHHDQQGYFYKYMPEPPAIRFWGKAALRMFRETLMVMALLVLAVQAWADAPPNWDRVIVHISDSDHMTPQECDEWHRARGWEGCGYNFVIEPDGAVYAARGYEKVGAHIKGLNRTALGICFVTKDIASFEQIQAFNGWLEQTRSMYSIMAVLPHRHFNKGKRCPGGVWDQLKRRGMV